MEQNKIKDNIKPKPNHQCIHELRFKQLEEKNHKLEILKTILTPKMFFSICLGLSVLIQTLKGV